MSRGKKILQLALEATEQEPEVIPPWLSQSHAANISDTDPETRMDDLESDAPSEHSDHDTDSEQSASDMSDEGVEPHVNLNFVGKDNVTAWAMHPQRTRGRRRRENIVINPPGVKLPARDAKTVLDAWKIFFSDETVATITDYTNIYLRKMRQKYGRERDCPDTTPTEISALLGLLYLAGVKKSAHLNVQEMWTNDGTAPDCFRATMSSRRFYVLLEALRFDNVEDRIQRKETDNLAPIRELFEAFVDKCLGSYQMGEYTTIDEMLPAFRGRCKFRQYIANKPTKYGIKIYALVDAKLFYVSNLEIYAGAQPDGPYKVINRADSVVQRLAAPILNTGRNITMDNYFTSVPLAMSLLQQRTTIVGTIRKNKRELPGIFVNTRDRPVYSSMFGFLPRGVLVSYVPKKNKNVLLLSTLHTGDEIDKNSEEKNKLEIITFYNTTKGGVDVVDELISQYSVSRISCRWPLTVFFCLLNIAGINSQIIYSANTNQKLKRRVFLKELALELIRPHVKSRLQIPSLAPNLRISMKNLVGAVEEEVPTRSNVAGFCSVCPWRKNRKTKKTCCKCNKYLCTEHARISCQECLEPAESSPSP